MRLGRGLTLLLGGARSGKSDLVVRLAEAWPDQVRFVATATAGDADMAARIERHRAERPAHWHVDELPRLEASDLAIDADDSLTIVDCVTMLVANLLFADLDDDAIVDQCGHLAAAGAGRTAPTLMISNEVGLGVHPETELGRRYRDLLGRVNRRIADEAETCLLVVAGRALHLEEVELRW